MSNNVYEDVFGIESGGRDSEHVEMMVDIYESADVISDQDFRTNTQQPLKQTEERDLLLTRVKDFSSEKDQLEKRLSSEKDSLMKQKDQLQQEKNYLKFLYEQDGWFYYQSSFYFISSEEKSWSESRRYCTDRKADLTIINNREEQDFVKKTSGGAFVWIGLTDSAKEGSWKWVDGTNMTTSFRFWRLFEPNGHRGENCAASHSSGWADYPCNAKFKWICEKIAF
nr:CD209 antigen-like protein C [Danio rerio]|eukprot:XP_021335187.1 CD209 antigen-like protein C [Danio rerio]